MTGWKLTLPCTRDEAEAIGELDVETLGLDPPPTLMTREPTKAARMNGYSKPILRANRMPLRWHGSARLVRLARRTTSNHWAMRIGDDEPGGP